LAEIPIRPAAAAATATTESVADRLARYMRAGTLGLTALPPLALYVHLPWCTCRGA
jgi:oxygen-independent coproporphyrinogen-3 oxidase